MKNHGNFQSNKIIDISALPSLFQMSTNQGYYADLVQQSSGKYTMATEEIERDLHRLVNCRFSESRIVIHARQYQLPYIRKNIQHLVIRLNMQLSDRIYIQTTITQDYVNLFFYVYRVFGNGLTRCFIIPCGSADGTNRGILFWLCFVYCAIFQQILTGFQ